MLILHTNANLYVILYVMLILHTDTNPYVKFHT